MIIIVSFILFCFYTYPDVSTLLSPMSPKMASSTSTVCLLLENDGCYYS